MLRELTSKHGGSEYQRRYWMEELYKKGFPQPGDSICVEMPEDLYSSIRNPTPTIPFNNGNQKGDASANPFKKTNMVTLKRKSDHRLDERELVTLLTTLDLSIVLKVFGSLLLERKVVLISRALK